MNTETKEKKPYVAPELTVVTLDKKFDLLCGSDCGGWGDDDDDAEIGSIPVFIDDRGMVKV